MFTSLVRRCLSLLFVLGVAGCSLTTDFARFDGFGDDTLYSDASFPAQASDAGALDAGEDGSLPPLEPGAVRVTKSGAGLGVITSDPAGIDCGDDAAGAHQDCTRTFALNTPITLTASAGEGFAFASWGGACADFAPTEPCLLTTGAPLEVTAEFALSHELVVVRAGHGSGVVHSLDGRIRCDGKADEICRALVPVNAEVTLMAEASADGSSFSGWGGACMGTEPCMLTMTSARMVNAVFDAEGEVSLIVSKVGAGEGTVESVPAGITCGSDCSEPFVATEDTEVVLTATPFAGSTFEAFTGCASTSGNTCTVRMGAVRSVNAAFGLEQHTLSVAWAGKGAGSVTIAGEAEVTCNKPQACSASHPHGTKLTLVATAAEGSSFVSWSGGGCGTSPTCSVTLGDDTLLVANFALDSYAVTVGAVGEGAVLCDGTLCAGEFMAAHGSILSFGSEPEQGWELSAWGGACASADAPGPCNLTVTAASNVIATFTRKAYSLQVSVDGTGSVRGTITRQGSAMPIACTQGTCRFDTQHGDVLALDAEPGNDTNFAGWSGQCGGTDACNLTVRGDLTLSASFSPQGEKVLSVAKTGKGTVTSTPGGIACGPECAGANAAFTSGSSVKLTAQSAPGYSFAGFSGCNTGSAANECTLTMSADVHDVSATFTPSATAVNVAVQQTNGKGNGTVSATGITCTATGGDCSESRPFDSTLELSASAFANSEFVGWGGDCSGVSETCRLTVSDVGGMNVTATFRIKTYAVDVTRTGGFDNESSVSFMPAGASCGASAGSDCRVFDHGSDVTLTAQPGAGSSFTRWTNAQGAGPCHNSTSATCALSSLEAAQSLTAQFGVRSYPLTVDVSGPGNVSSGDTPPKIDCGNAGGTKCMASYTHASTVTLTAQSGPNKRFVGWGGACADYKDEPTCSVTMGAARSVSAEFKGVRRLSVELTGQGVGTLSPLVSGGGVSCATLGGTCTVMVEEGESVTLSASAPSWAQFAGFQGNCSPEGAGTCTVRVEADTTVQAAFEPTGALVFVTSATFNGKLGGGQGARGADALCSELARKQQLPGPWVAWLSDKSSHPLQYKTRPGRMVALTAESTTPLVRPDGRYVAKDGFVALVEGKLELPIDIDETGAQVLADTRNGGLPVWTATQPSGFRNENDAPFCDDWNNSANNSFVKEGVGSTAALDGEFTMNTQPGGIIGFPPNNKFRCNQQARLYCIRDLATVKTDE